MIDTARMVCSQKVSMFAVKITLRYLVINTRCVCSNDTLRGMVKNRRLARAISDAGWGQFVQIIGEKAERYGRTIYSVSRWLASSKTCATSMHRLDELALQVHRWTCPACRAVHDRDYNAAKVIRAAGLAERLNASHESGRDRESGPSGAPVSPSAMREALGDEAGSTPTAA